MSNSESLFKSFAQEQLKMQGDNIRRWAAQTENELLRQLAVEVIQAATGQAKSL